MNSYTLQLQALAPKFSLPATDGKRYTLDSFKTASALVIFFTCNHCPYVIASDEYTRLLAEKYQGQGVQFVGINANSKETYPEDSFEEMVKRMERYSFPWIYLHDESQDIARKYGALCTPHFYLFNHDRCLIYTGYALDHPRDIKKATTYPLDNALQAYFSNAEMPKITNPIGCNIKWEGKPAKWMPPEACSLI